MSGDQSHDPDTLLARVEEWVEVYNAQDFDACASMVAEDLHFVHHNRGIEVHGRTEFVEGILRNWRDAYVPDRKLEPAVRMAVNGNVVFREQMWTATAKVDVPGFADAGQPIRHDFCTVLVFNDDGLICEYNEYG
jgi:ketosteroid isomerase-like protein